jgi:RNA-directed DNA polymerase
MLMPDGTLAARTTGTPQGAVISPLISNIVLHHVFDEWMEYKYPNTPFERYADDAVIHCEHQRHAEAVLKAVTQRLADYKLEINPTKTKLVFCKNAKRKGTYENERFDFLGYSFKSRLLKSSRGDLFVGFSPAISDTAVRAISQTIRRWRIHNRSDASLEDLAADINPQVQGWCNYYGKFYRTAMMPVLKHINEFLVKWAMRKYKRMHRKQMQARRWLAILYRERPDLFAHWKFGAVPNSSARIVGAG